MENINIQDKNNFKEITAIEGFVLINTKDESLKDYSTKSICVPNNYDLELNGWKVVSEKDVRNIIKYIDDFRITVSTPGYKEE